MSDFRNRLSEFIWQEKLKHTTFKRLIEETGVSHVQIRKMLYQEGDVYLGTLLAILDATGYDLKIVRKKENT